MKTTTLAANRATRSGEIFSNMVVDLFFGVQFVKTMHQRGQGLVCVADILITIPAVWWVVDGTEVREGGANIVSGQLLARQGCGERVFWAVSEKDESLSQPLWWRVPNMGSSGALPFCGCTFPSSVTRYVRPVSGPSVTSTI